jgi:hypothetical protein
MDNHEEVMHCFLNQKVAYDTIMIIQIHVPPSQNISGTEPVLGQQPKENLVLRLALTSPKPLEGRVDLLMPNQDFVNFG